MLYELRVLDLLRVLFAAYVLFCAGCDAGLFVDRPPVPSAVTDCASKAAMGGLLHALVCDLSQHNIQV